MELGMPNVDFDKMDRWEQSGIRILLHHSEYETQ